MTRSTRNRMCVAITLLALCALFVDRFLMGGSTGPADAAAQDTTQDITARVQALSPTGLSIPELPFPRGLPQASNRAMARDLFAPPSQQPSLRRRNARNADTADPTSAAVFSSRNRLEAVISDGGSQLAVVNGKWVRIGQSIDGCTLTRVDGTQAHFRCARDAIVLDLAQFGESP